MPVFEVVDELGVLRRTHIAGPHNLRSVDIGFVIDPFVETYFVIRPVVNNGELASREFLQAGERCRALRIAGGEGAPNGDTSAEPWARLRQVQRLRANS